MQKQNRHKDTKHGLNLDTPVFTEENRIQPFVLTSCAVLSRRSRPESFKKPLCIRSSFSSEYRKSVFQGYGSLEGDKINKTNTLNTA